MNFINECKSIVTVAFRLSWNYNASVGRCSAHVGWIHFGVPLYYSVIILL